MTPFRWRRGRLVTTFDAHEAALLRHTVTEVRDLLGGSTSNTSDMSGDPSIASGHPSTDTADWDAVRARLLPDGHRSDDALAQDYRALTEASLRTDKAADANRLLDTLTDSGGKIELEAETAQAWLRTINDVRLALGVQLDVQETDDPMQRAEQDGDARWAVYSWLTAVQGLLVDALMASNGQGNDR